MKKNLILVSFLTLALALSFSVALAEPSSAVAKSENANAVQGNRGQNQDQEDVNGIEGVDNPDSSTTSNDNESDEELEGKEKGQANAEEHRSVVANFVQELLQVANREGGIGEQVREVAREQNEATEDTVQAMENAQNRNRVRTFFFGPDYKNLGQLRSEMVQVRNRIAQLNRLAEKAEGEDSKLALEEQIQEMEQEQTRIENFIKENEEKFSLFGWVKKLFGLNE